MKFSKTYVRIFFLILVASISFLLFSYSHKNVATGEPNCEGGKCCQKAQTEFILWESLTHNLLSASL